MIYLGLPGFGRSFWPLIKISQRKLARKRVLAADACTPPTTLGSHAALPVFKLPQRTAKMLRADLKAVGIAYKDDKGQVIDFHALRHTFITLLVRSGVSVKTAQVMARHSTPSLTIGRYAHADTADVHAALASLPSVVRANPENTPSPKAASGGPVTTLCHDRAPNAHQAGYVEGRKPTQTDIGTLVAAALERQRKSWEIWGLDGQGQHLAVTGGNAPRRTRTYNPLIKSQLLCQLS